MLVAGEGLLPSCLRPWVRISDSEDASWALLSFTCLFLLCVGGQFRRRPPPRFLACEKGRWPQKLGHYNPGWEGLGAIGWAHCRNPQPSKRGSPACTGIAHASETEK